MTAIITVLAIYVVAAFSLHYLILEPKTALKKRGDNNAVYIIAVMLAALIVRIICAVSYRGHETDMSCFTAWSDMIYNGGIGQFYKSEAFHDYPPGYMYVLYVIGAIKNLFGVTGKGEYLLVKLPAIICDLVSGWFVYKLSRKKFDDSVSTILSAIYLFNPAVLLNSSLWGQVDSVYTMCLMFMVYLAANRKLIASYFVFAVCIFIKPQAFIFTPIVFLGLIEETCLPKFNSKEFFKNIGFGLLAIASVFVMSLPFGVGNVIEQYTATLASYPYMTVNAFNLYGALGMNWDGLTAGGTVFGYAMLVIIVAYTVYVFLKSKSRAKYYFLGAILAFATFMLSTKMHDRYAFPAMLMLLLAYTEAPKKENMYLYILNSGAQFFNAAWVLFIYQTDINKYFKSPVMVVASIINLLIFAYTIYISQKLYVGNKIDVMQKEIKIKNKTQAKIHFSSSVKKNRFTVSEKLPKVKRFDIIAILVIMAVYSAVALYDLGDRGAPETEYMLNEGEITLDLGEEKDISKIKIFFGPYELNEGRTYDMEILNGSKVSVKKENVNSSSVFCWNEKEVNSKGRYIKFSTAADYISFKEIGIIGNNGEKLVPVNVSDANIALLFDEQKYVPGRTTFRNSTYFDEIYHARTAYEFVHSLPVYEWTHPPLGKVFIAIGVKLFGMCPFGWRIAGTVFGIFMIPIIYMFALKLTKKSWLAVVTCLFFTFDFMHFAQTRIATIDVYGTFFIMLMYYFMYKYYTMSFYDTPLKKTFITLLLCGISTGLAIASKWTGMYAAVGLAVIFFITLYKRYEEYRYAVKNVTGTSGSIPNKQIIADFKPKALKTIGWCCICFIVIPIIIYCLSYIPYLKAPGMNGLKSIIDNQSAMYTYHSSSVLGSTHPYSSRWYEWIIMKRPIWYYSGTVSDGVKEGISAFGNPAVWWMGIPAFFYMLYLALKDKDKKALFLVLAYLAQLVSWIPITRLTFIYHYFPSVPFIVLMLGYSINCIYERAKNKKAVIYGAFAYAAVVVILFVMFYPVLSGRPTNVEYVDNWLRWFSSWVLL